MTCPDCEKAANTKHHGGYRMQCVRCCARLVASARPSRQHQEAMFAAIARFPGAPTRQEVLDCLRQNFSAPHSVHPSSTSQTLL